MAELTETNRRRLHELALEQYGYVTTRDARRLGISPNAFHQIVHRGGLTRVAHGLYRFDDVPVTARDGYMEAVLTVGDDAFLVDDAVLALHDLALVNPSRLRVGVPRRARTTVPATIEVVRRRPADAELTVYEGIPATSVARALVDSVGVVMRERLIDAAEDAVERGLVRRTQARELFAQLGAEA